MEDSKTFKARFLQSELTTAKEIDKIVGFYDNTRELIDLINRLKDETIVYKSCIANLIDYIHGPVNKNNPDNLVVAFRHLFRISPEMAKIIIAATNETTENKTFDIV